MPTGIGNEVAWWCPSLEDTGNGTLTFYDQIASGINGSLDNGETGDWVADTTSGGIRCITLDGTNERGLIVDDNRFTFGNGTTDSAFSVSIWVYATSFAANPCVISKAASATSGEWHMIIGSLGDWLFRCSDLSATAFIGRRTATGSVAINTWYNLVATYSGSGAASGIKLYRNGTQVDTLDDNSGTYVAMENTTQPVTIGARGAALYTPGRWDDCRIFDVVVSGANITLLASARGYQPASGAFLLLDTPMMRGGFSPMVWGIS